MSHGKYDLILYALGELDLDTKKKYKEHFSQCSVCKNELNDIHELLFNLEDDKESSLPPDPERARRVVRAMAGEYESATQTLGISRWFLLPRVLVAVLAVFILVPSLALFISYYDGNNSSRLIFQSGSNVVLVRDLETGKLLDQGSVITIPARIKAETSFDSVGSFSVKDQKDRVEISLLPSTSVVLSFGEDEKIADLDRGNIVFVTGDNISSEYRVLNSDMSARLGPSSRVEVIAQELLRFPVYIIGESEEQFKWTFINKTVKDVISSLSDDLGRKIEIASPGIEEFTINFQSNKEGKEELFRDFVRQLEQQNLTVVRKSQDLYTVNILVSDLAKLVKRRLVVRVYKGNATLFRKSTSVTVSSGKEAGITEDLDITMNSISDELNIEEVMKGSNIDYDSLRRSLKPSVIRADSDRYIIEYDIRGKYITDISQRINRKFIGELLGTDRFKMPWLQ